MTSDPAAASGSYGSLFGWNIRSTNMGMEYRVAIVSKVLDGRMGVPAVGRMATIADPQGAVINVITYRQA